MMHYMNYVVGKNQCRESNNFWFWYIDNLVAGNFEELNDNLIKRNQLCSFLAHYFGGKQTTKLQRRLLLVTSPYGLRNGSLDEHLSKKLLSSTFGTSIDEFLTFHGHNGWLTIFPISNSDEKLYEFYKQDLYCMGYLMEECERGIISTPEFGWLSKTENAEEEDCSDYEDELEGLTINFAKQFKQNICENAFAVNPILRTLTDTSDTLSLKSFESYEDSFEIGYCHEERDCSCRALRHYPLHRVQARVNHVDNYNRDLTINVVSLLGKDDASGKLWHAVRQLQDDDWVIYDADFSLNNLENCKLEDILLNSDGACQTMVILCNLQ
ncbi:uncharacterized protein KNAG_0C03240 [Huiozyma naganishii CBS 8797]|uniref:Uncharacterized protein n=1 Tax=Huiozyma naganishii (strain ATCC MYA-139 / BCRC 22969 / CBS 8797 / KCTC 17520 / NBRC 10181 / NCYC 3082 / Yp74L-3) TaxID=1071383 RepID=J7RIS9_HUIN7|nr:hypothetical protein KNAG_0C03240 [Kazachstania naganishii CBS 8797]CCK69433.1 hypothetical protein KNAG_0C03240 [Kazachstania naganishii CBS 8797]